MTLEEFDSNYMPVEDRALTRERALKARQIREEYYATLDLPYAIDFAVPGPYVHKRNCGRVRLAGHYDDWDLVQGAADYLSELLTEAKAREWLAGDESRRLCPACKPQLGSKRRVVRRKPKAAKVIDMAEWKAARDNRGNQ